MKLRLPSAVSAARLLALVLICAAALVFLPAGLWRRLLTALAQLPAGQPQLAATTLLPLRLLAGAAIAVLAAFLWALGRHSAAAERGLGELTAAARRLGRGLRGDLRRLAGHRPALVVCLIGVAARLAFLGAPMRHDEAKTFFAFVARPLVDGLSNYYVPNNHILHTFFAHFAWRLFGDAPEVLRLPALLAGCALLPLTWLAGVRLFEQRSATWAAALVAACPPLVDYSTDARGYSLVAAAGLAAFWILAGRDRQPLAWAAVAVLGGLGLFAVPVMVIPLGVLFVHRVLGAPPPARAGIAGRAAATGIAALSIAALLYLPAILRSGLESLVANSYLAPLPVGELLRAVPRLVVAQVRFLTGELWPPMLLALLPPLALLVPGRRRGRRARHLAAAMLLAAAAIFLQQRILPKDRAWLALAPLLMLVSARAGAELALLAGGRQGRQCWLAPAVAAVLAGALVAANITSANVECPEAEGFAATIAAGAAEDALALTATPAAGPLRFYLMRQGFPLGRFVWATDPPRAAPLDRPLFLVIRRGSFTAGDLGLPDLAGCELLAEGPTSALWFRPPPARGPANTGDRAGPSDVSFAPP